MGHRDDFYVVANIVGYTGNINDNPSVYFQAATANGIEFGRITQAHDHADNVGRNRVRIKADYQVYNKKMVNSVYLCGLIVTHKTVSVEYYDGGERHTSRNPIVLRADFKPNDLALVSSAIIAQQTIKSKY